MASTTRAAGEQAEPLLQYLSEGQLAERLGLEREQLRQLRQTIDQAAAVPDHLKREPTAQYLTEHQLAERLTSSRRKLSEWRLSGAGGPEFVKVGRSVLYPTASVLDWEATLPRRSTSG